MIIIKTCRYKINKYFLIQSDNKQIQQKTQKLINMRNEDHAFTPKDMTGPASVIISGHPFESSLALNPS